MKKGSTLFLKLVIIVFGIAVLALCIFAFPSAYQGMSIEWPGIEAVQPIAFIALYASAIPFFISLYQGMKLLGLIDSQTAFSHVSVRSLRIIKYAATSMTLCYFFVMPLVYLVADYDDAPGLIIVGMVFACSPLVIATFAAVLEKLVQSAIDIKSENELTV